MNKKLNENITFTKIDFSEKNISNTEFDSCIFVNCSFSKSNLTNSDFIDCKFDDCDFSIVELSNTGLKNVLFLRCKLLGFDFTNCKDLLLSFSFENCILDYAIFHKKKIHKTKFLSCSMKEVDFSNADLTSSYFMECDLSRAHFYQTILEKADFRTAINFSIDPEFNKLKNAKFSAHGAIELLNKYQIIIG